MLRNSVRAALALTCTCAAAHAQTAPRLSLVAPSPNAILASAATSIVLDSTEPLDPLTIDGSVRVWGRWSGAMDGTKRLEGAQRIVFEPARAFFPGETVTVLVSRALRSQAGLSLSGGFTASFWIGWPRGSGNFGLAFTLPVRSTGEGLIQTYGIYAGDLDGDGAPDFSIPNEVANDVRVMKNDGCGVFGTPEPHDVPPGSTPSANDAGDFNRDGFPDMAVANISGDTASVLLSNGAGSYQPAVSYPSGDAPRGVTVLDLEGDGDSDFAVTLQLPSVRSTRVRTTVAAPLGR